MGQDSKKFTTLALTIAMALGGCTVTVNTDLDSDGVPNEQDRCNGTAPGEPVDADGCSTLDDDGDGVFNDRDACPGTPPGTDVGITGCERVDLDADGVPDDIDQCLGTRAGDPVDTNGCSTLDDDGDGVFNDDDACPDTAPGALVDAAGCEVEGFGTLDAVWTINGGIADGFSCADAGIDFVRFTVLDGTPSGPVYQQWMTPCEAGGFDSRFDDTAPTVPLMTMFFSYFEALGPGGGVLATSDAFELELSGALTHASLAPSNFETFVEANELTFPLVWETTFGSNVFDDCVGAVVDTMMGYDLFDGAFSLFGERGVPCADTLIFDDLTNPAFGPGSYELVVDASAFDGTKWGATCAIEYDGGVATADFPCQVFVVP